MLPFYLASSFCDILSKYYQYNDNIASTKIVILLLNRNGNYTVLMINILLPNFSLISIIVTL